MTNIVASAEMLINKPSNEVFDAFVEPRTIEKFWLKNASAPLAKNARVEWEFMVGRHTGIHEPRTSRWRVSRRAERSLLTGLRVVRDAHR